MLQMYVPFYWHDWSTKYLSWYLQGSKLLYSKTLNSQSTLLYSELCFVIFFVCFKKQRNYSKLAEIFWLRISLENFVLIVLEIFTVYNQSLFQSLDSKNIQEFICLKFLQHYKVKTKLWKRFHFYGCYFVGFVSGLVSNFPPILYSGHFIVHCPVQSGKFNLKKLLHR